MTRTESIELTAKIQEIVGVFAPAADLSPETLLKIESAKRQGRLPFWNENPDMKVQSALEGFLRQFLMTTSEIAAAGPAADFYRELYRQTKLFLAKDFTKDAYLRAVRLPEGEIIREGDFRLTMAKYRPGEFFAYNMPSGYQAEQAVATAEPLVVPRLGFTEEGFSFPAVYQDGIPWMSACPSEMNSLREPLEHCRTFVRSKAQRTGKKQKVLVLGLGLAYFPFHIAEEEDVGRLDVVEISRAGIDLYEHRLKPCFPPKQQEKIHIIEGDAFEILSKVQPGDYDYCFADTWESQFDGAKDYLRIKRQEERLKNENLEMGFSYWIEPEIKAYLKETFGD